MKVVFHVIVSKRVLTYLAKLSEYTEFLIIHEYEFI